MQALVSVQKNITILTLSGRMDATTANVFGDACKAALDDGAKKIIIDLGAVEYISSAGLRVILTMMKAAKAASGKLAFCSMQSMVSDVFKISGFSSMLSIYPSTEEALQAMA